MNLNAVALVGRANLDKPGNSPFSPMGSGICIDADGVIATCCHTLIDFMRQWSPYDIPSAPDVKEVIADVERQERPFFFFPSRFPWQSKGEHEAEVYPVISFQGNPSRDVAVVELGGGGSGRPLPFVAIDAHPPTIGEVVHFAGVQGTETVDDPEGNILGWRMPWTTARVVAWQPQGFLVDCPIHPGMSGSGVCNERGNLVGIIIEHWPREAALMRTGLDQPLGLAAYAGWLLPEVTKLRTEAAARAAAGELPWCGLSGP